MRINKLIQVGRLEVYIGRRPHWEPHWCVSRIDDGWGLWACRWNVLACWVRKRLCNTGLEAKLAGAAERISLTKEQLLALSDVQAPPSGRA
jgi:hypothetical protein